MLLQSETEQLIKEAQAGSAAAKEKLVTENAPLIKSIVARYRNKGVEYDDLFQLGAMGFVKAVNHFDASYRVKFSTYAVPMIMGEIKRFLRDDGAVKVSRSLKMTSGKINRFCERYSGEHQKEPSVEEIAAELGLEPSEVVFAMDSAKMPVSLFEKEDGDDKSLGVIDRLAAPQGPDINLLLSMKDGIASLTPREKKIILLRYFRDKTQSEIARELGVSQVQVSRLESKILAKLRDKLSEK